MPCGWAVLLAVVPWAGEAQGTAAARVAVEGRVVNALTGAGVARALVTTSDGHVAEMTDGDGRFRMDLAGGGAVALQARRPGFLPMQGQSVAAGGPATVELRLEPEAVVEGTVTTANGMPARGAGVMLEELVVENGRQRWERRQGAQVNFEGEYRMAELPAGTYRVGTREWVPEEGRGEEGEALPEEAYPPVRSGEIRVGTGEDARLDLPLRAAPYFAVEMPVLGCGGGAGVEVRTASGEDSGMRLGFEGDAVRGALPQGSYRVEVRCFGPEFRMGEVALTVGGGPVRTAPVSLGTGVTIPVAVRQELTGAAGSQAASASTSGRGGSRFGGSGGSGPTVRLERVGADGGDQDAGRPRRGTDGAQVIAGVGPGEYRVRVSAGQGYVAAATSGGVDLRREPLVVGSGGGAAPIELVVRDDAGAVKGTAGGGASRVRLLPLDNELAGEMDGSVGSDGTFAVEGVAPGRWLVVGSGGTTEPIAFREPEMVAAWERQGAVADVAAGATATVSIADVARVASAGSAGGLE